MLSFLYGDERISFKRVSQSTKTNKQKVIVKVHPDCRVVVAAPQEATDQDVLLAVQKRSRWIYEQLRDFHQLNKYVTPRQYVSGESHLYLGKQYVLKVHVEPNELQGIKLLRGKLKASVRRYNPEQVKDLLVNWYKLRAKDIFSRRLDVLLEQTLWVKEKPQLRIFTMQTQWGSCSPKGRITLNPNLVKAPQECIDYVILHELCHLAEHNHSDRFYRLLSQVMPQWEGVKQRLDNMAGKILL